MTQIFLVTFRDDSSQTETVACVNHSAVRNTLRELINPPDDRKEDLEIFFVDSVVPRMVMKDSVVIRLSGVEPEPDESQRYYRFREWSLADSRMAMAVYDIMEIWIESVELREK